MTRSPLPVDIFIQPIRAALAGHRAAGLTAAGRRNDHPRAPRSAILYRLDPNTRAVKAMATEWYDELLLREHPVAEGSVARHTNASDQEKASIARALARKSL